MDTDYIVAVMKPHNEVICYKSLCFCEKYRVIYLNKFICPLMLYIMLRSLYRPSV